nr:hypothetical protein [Tanacetum cinerariifolium]
CLPLLFVDLEISTQANGAQSSRVPIPLPKDPYEAVRQAYLVGTDTESEPFKGEAETPELPHIVAPPTCHVEESEGSGMSGMRSTSSDSTAPFSPDQPLTDTTPALVFILRRTARMAMRVPPAMSHGLSAGIADVAAMSDSVFRKRFRSSYDRSPSPTLPVRKSESEDAEDEGPTAEDEDLLITNTMYQSLPNPKPHEIPNNQNRIHKTTQGRMKLRTRNKDEMDKEEILD